MKRILRYSTSPLLIIILFLSACSGDESILTKTELLTVQSWKLSFVKVMDIESEPVDCAKDDSYIFNKDKTSSQDEGATKCHPNDAQTKSGTWKFSSDETILTLTTGKGSSAFSIDEQILELSSSSLKLKYSILGFIIEEHYIH